MAQGGRESGGREAKAVKKPNSRRPIAANRANAKKPARAQAQAPVRQRLEVDKEVATLLAYSSFAPQYRIFTSATFIRYGFWLPVFPSISIFVNHWKLCFN